MQQADLSRDMQRNADWIRRGMGGYAVMSEATITQGINQLREQLKQVQQAMAPGQDGKDAGDKLAEQTLTQVEPELQLKTPLDQHGVGRLQVLGFPIFVSFDAASRRLFLLATQNPAPEALTQRLQSLQPRVDAPMLPLETEVDTSGQGFFVWLDAKTIFSLTQSLIPPEELLVWQRLGGHVLRQVALGMGVSAGKGRFKLILDMPRVGVRTLLPAVEAPLAFDTAGAPEGLVMLGLPNASDWQQAEAFVKTNIPDVDEQIQPFKDGVLAATGLHFDDWLNLFGPELAYVAEPEYFWTCVARGQCHRSRWRWSCRCHLPE